MVVKATLEWTGPAGFDDEVAIGVRADRIGDKSFDLRFSASVEGRPACEGVITYVSVKPGTKESRSIPAALRVHLEQSLEREPSI
jgi:acyl-CoA thioesterase FadM